MFINILSYNIHKGFSLGNLKLTIHKIKDAIASVNADVVFLQEVVGEQQKKLRAYKEYPLDPHFEYMAKNLYPYVCYSKNATYGHGHHGNAILSRYPLSFWEHINISTNRFEQRGLLHARTLIPNQKLKVELDLFCVHLDLFHRGRKKQYKQVMQRIYEYCVHDSPFIIAGDFNDWHKKASSYLTPLGPNEAFKALYGRYAKTFPVHYPLLPLDRVYLRGIEVCAAHVLTGHPWRGLSDHAPLLVKLKLD